jgi:hypothetical protein
MHTTKAGFRVKDLVAVYQHLGFEITEGSKHCLAQHPRFPALVATIRRSNPLPTGYIATVLELEASLQKELEREQEKTNASQPDDQRD